MVASAPAAAGPLTADEPVPVAVVARTSTLALQDPVASVRRQLRACVTQSQSHQKHGPGTAFAVRLRLMTRNGRIRPWRTRTTLH